MQFLIVLVLIAVAIGLVVTYWYVVAAGFLVVVLLLIARYALKERYFASQEFRERLSQVTAVVAEHNEVAAYAAEIEERGLFQLADSSRGAQAHLASFQNTSQHNYRRDRNSANYQAPNVHNCSLQVVRNASADPLRYLIKYFGIRPDEQSLAQVERYGDSISRLEAALGNLKDREMDITGALRPPWFISKYYQDELMRRVGVTLSPISVRYPVYIFEYVSAGGNSSQKTTVTLNGPTTDALVETLGEKIRFRMSAAGQRALMTSRLRDSIKARDRHTCQNPVCQVSLRQEPHLLLEVDHIVPVSRGGQSVPGNLQTLCWRCNRSKSNKMPIG